VAPTVGTVVNGVYTAPAVIPLQQTVTVAAASAADPTKVATAIITLLPTVSITVTPSSATLSASQTAQFNASLSGTTNPNVTWSLSPAVGSVTNGLYQAPATINSQQIVTVTATSLADATKSASATIALVPTVGLALTPSSTSLTGGQSTQFNVTIAGAPAPATAVTWTLAPAVGNITNGLYTAPVTINALQTVILTVASIADPTQSAQATINLTTSTSSSPSVSPSQATLNPSQTQQFTASNLGTGPKWTINPTLGSITTSGLYTAPSTVSSQSTVTVTATNATDSTKAASATVTLNPSGSQTPPPPTTTIQLPIEVMGPANTQVPVSLNIPSGSNLTGQLQLWLQIHGLRYETQASVQVNGGAWLPISDSNSNVTVQGLGGKVGGIGGGFATLKLTLNLAAGSIQQGLNTITFQFNGTNGISSGFRVLDLNILAADGSQLIPGGSFTYDDPSTWQIPLNTPTDIQAGKTLWTSGNLTVPGVGAIQAKCGMCHTQDGRDLKYFNYSSFSIQARSMFHGLTAQQGNQIASYIRSLNTPAPASARPWNPPYQPGPGTDSKPVSDWAAGAGLEGVLDDDLQMLPYLMPSGSTTNWQHNAYLNVREIPIPLQLADWNHWLPTTHPLDSIGTTFTNSALFALYQKLRGELLPNNATAYANAASDIGYWGVRDMELEYPIVPSSTDPRWQDPNFTNAMYSLRLWSLAKQWELNQEFGLEGMPQQVFGPQAENRAWFTQMPFITFNVPPTAAGVGNGLPITMFADRYRWYHLQLMLNDGNGLAQGTWPIDWPYALGFPSNDLTWDSQNSRPRFPDPSLLILWLVKGLQAKDRFNPTNGWSEYDSDPGQMVQFPAIASVWSGVSSSTQLQLMNSYLQVWLNKVQTITQAQWLASGYANATVVLDQTGSQFTTRFARMLPAFRTLGVNLTLLNQIVSFAQANWPSYNWNGALNAPCVWGNLGSLQCTIPH
jgi:hypothetical protein